MSRFSEALGAAQESSQKSGYPKTQPSEQQKTQSSKKSATQESKTAQSNEESGYPTTQPSEQQETQSSKKSTTQESKTGQESSETSGYPKTQPSEQQETQQPTTTKKTPDKLAKRENPDYTQTTFRIPKKLSRQINRTLMDLADEGIEMDRSDLLEALTFCFIRLVNEVGAVEALEQFKNLGTQVDE
ncbi:hypothetical protein IQ247_13295 [Plectonema cf. radiosum LEGE 06105]|uniref:Uncharacterized protein n=1 Tax=Plectonema cf. radiosum LEGE 06105 TaxID=945769 RepID=A0A8J7JTE9_9CYAN|nr:hypothetical protein [Plectonema radiosum]MBE9213629.1 hypothetical protein [Plectonema cf. radiosum LEGE 06105]